MSRIIVYLLNIAIGYCVSINLVYPPESNYKEFEDFQRTLMVIPVDYEGDDLIVEDLVDQRMSDIQYIDCVE